MEILDYIEQNGSPDEANKVLELITEQLNTLSNLPDRGHTIPELSELKMTQFREIHCRVYRIIYELRSQTVFLRAILDGRHKLQDLLFDRLMRD
ncbi:MAG: plasmid stabilization protein [Candidatus Marinimicrobia bacterium CG_4_9_14_3_um_filter_48_9]|nr:MAG: plasmid stabilization protein [Candidatus Marinimicrobia bacterium CG_4_9_14_3_um_filter_48_9]